MCKSHIPYLVPGIITDPTRQICTIHIHNKSRGIHIPPAKYGVPRRSRKNKKRKKSCRSNRWRNTCLEKSRSWNGDLIRPMSAERGYGWATYIWQKKSYPIYYIRPSFSLPPINGRTSDPGPHSTLFSLLPTTVRALYFYREKTSDLSSLVDSRRIGPTHARHSQQLIFFFQWNSWSHHDSIRTPGSTLIAFEGKH